MCADVCRLRASAARCGEEIWGSDGRPSRRGWRHQTNGPQRGEENRHFGSLRPASLRRHMRSAAPFSPQFCTCAPTAERRCPLGSVHAGEQPHRSRSATVSRSERSAQATRPPLAALATDLIASSISRPSASKLSMINIVGREADAERSRVGSEEAHAARVRYHVLRRMAASRTLFDVEI